MQQEAYSSEQPPPKRFCGRLEEIDWPVWESETKSKRVTVLQNILAAPTTTNDQKLLLVGERMENFEQEDATMLKIKTFSGCNWPLAGTAEESVWL